jgi:hypothetical protein
MALHFEFPFRLGATDNRSVVPGVYLPEKLQVWEDVDGSTITFFPFLVILKRENRESAFWMPYWHKVEKPDGKIINKYGQWAPYMDGHLFESLIDQARRDGHLS